MPRKGRIGRVPGVRGAPSAGKSGKNRNRNKNRNKNKKKKNRMRPVEPTRTDIVSSIKVRVSPKAAQGAIVGWMEDGFLKVRILAAPEGGRANIELLRLLGEQLRIPIGNLSIVHGSSSTSKILKVVGLDEEEVRRRLSK
jgi:uncharacterized protein (TIGR00251 family)